MSTLERCTEALLQQKVVQASNYERLESRLMELKRAKRSLFFGLKEAITDVERRRQDLGELRDEAVRLRQQLQHSAVAFGALTAFVGDEQRRCARVQDAADACAAAWTGCPARAAHIVRALQERSGFRRELAATIALLARARALCDAIRGADAVRAHTLQRLSRHDAVASAVAERCTARVALREKMRLSLLEQCAATKSAREAQQRRGEAAQRALLAAEALKGARRLWHGHCAAVAETLKDAERNAVRHAAQSAQCAAVAQAYEAAARHCARAAAVFAADAAAKAAAASDAFARFVDPPTQRRAAAEAALHARLAANSAARTTAAATRGSSELWAARGGGAAALRSAVAAWRGAAQKAQRAQRDSVAKARARRRAAGRQREAREALRAEEALTRAAVVEAEAAAAARIAAIPPPPPPPKPSVVPSAPVPPSAAAPSVVAAPSTASGPLGTGTGRARRHAATEKKRPRSPRGPPPRGSYPPPGAARWARCDKLPLSAVARAAAPGSPLPRAPETRQSQRSAAQRPRPTAVALKDAWGGKSEDIFADIFSF